MRSLAGALAISLAALTSSCEKAILGDEERKPPVPVAHTSKLATLLDSMRYASDFPALAGAIVTDTGIVDAQAVGSRRYAGPLNVTADDEFHLGSNTKAITSVLLGVLVDQGLLGWETTLPAVFPELAGSMRPEYRGVTLRNLLSHSAGLMRDPNLTLRSSTPMEQRAEVVAWTLGQPPAVPRGSYLYSNLGYIVAGAIAERVTGRPYEELLHERVLRPLGITAAGFGPMGTPGLDDQPLQHTNSHAPLEPTPDADNPVIYSPPGRLHMSIGGWATYIRWVLAAEAGHQTFLAPPTAAMLTTGVVSDDGGGLYALGWGISNQPLAGGRVLSHAGSNGFNYSVARLAPSRRFGVIVATNQGPGTQANPLNDAAGRLIDFYLSGK